MKTLLLIFGLMICVSSFANDDNGNHKAPKGYNYKKHYRKARKVRFMNRTFNLNNCKNKSHHG
jgi:hypothetical protein